MVEVVVRVGQEDVQPNEGHLLDCAVPNLAGVAVVPSITKPFLVLVWPFVTSGCFPKVDGAI